MIVLALFLFPVAVYCLVLGMVNRRPHPVLVPGAWDFLGVLLAASGLLVFGGPALLGFLYDREVREFLIGRLRPADVSFSDLFAKWWRIWILYYAVVCGAGVFLIWWRRRSSVVYNADPAVFDEILARTLDQVGVEWTRMGNRVFIGFRAGRKMPAGGEQPASEHVQVLSGYPRAGEKYHPTPGRVDQAVLDVEPFYATRNVTLQWTGTTGPIREDVEAELARALTQVPAGDNPAATWFSMIASVLFFLIFLGIALAIVLAIRTRRPF